MTSSADEHHPITLAWTTSLDHAGLMERIDAPESVVALVELVIRTARDCDASDIHVVPAADHCQVLWRIDGVLHAVDRFAESQGRRIISRLKVLAGLLTYQTEVPQEGRLRDENEEIRISTFPTLHGEKAVVRLLRSNVALRTVADLGLPDPDSKQLRGLLAATSGVLLVVGPAGSGKTTTAYACLREIATDCQGGRSLVSLEDPIEVAIPEVVQSQVKPASDFTLEVGLRSLLRQDPDVILVGEIRDRNTAAVVYQASLTGHLVITTFHASSAVSAVSRLLDMQIEPYLLRGGTLGILCQRLVRRLCSCAVPCGSISGILSLNCEQAFEAVGCEACYGTGYRGRFLISEMICPAGSDMSQPAIDACDFQEMQRRALAGGMVPQGSRLQKAIEMGWTSPSEAIRVFGDVPWTETDAWGGDP